MADFGWSAGCIAEAIKTANKIRKALQDSGGAKQHYAETVAFLYQIDATFKHLEKHIEEHPDSPYRKAILQQLKLIEAPWKRVEVSYVDKYEKSLNIDSKRSKLRQAPRMVQWAVKDIDGAVRKEKAGILEPLGMIDSLLYLEGMDEVKKVGEKCQEILDDGKVSEISSMLMSRFDGLDAHARSQATAHFQYLERFAGMRLMMEQHQRQLVALMRTANANANPNEQCTIDAAHPFIRMPKEHNKTVEKSLPPSIASTELRDLIREVQSEGTRLLLLSIASAAYFALMSAVSIYRQY
ncbi:hypothetical protein K458DRAFT_299907 [Lentithecium fluviatile CBS 122367]|uniref:Uncharacterized protein n=1 Tax=Lentithecium fluviatile CBS 122367 TaxID=1168545 RepID=A0A6G1J4Z9_9PLEO|nr:hypothetical protein K458DRAFT_299907 [Lentithecium fluviatile CBS 122367]